MTTDDERVDRLRKDMAADGFGLRELSDGTYLVTEGDEIVSPNGWRNRAGGKYPGLPIGGPRPLSLDEVEVWFRS